MNCITFSIASCLHEIRRGSVSDVCVALSLCFDGLSQCIASLGENNENAQQQQHNPWVAEFECKAPVTHSLQPVGDLLATKISGGRREVAGWLQGGRRLIADRLQKVAGMIWSQGGFGCCKWNLSATKSIVERFLVVADRLATDRRPVATVADNPDTVFSRRLIANQSPIGCRPISKKLQSFCYKKTNAQDTVANQSPTDRQSVADRSPTDRRLIADGSTTTVRLHDIIL